MNSVHFIWAQPWVDRLGLTLIHFLWQGLLISLLYAVVRHVLGFSGDSNKRYVLACSALALMVCTPCITFIALGANETTQSAIVTGSTAMAPSLKAGQPRPDLSWLASVSVARPDAMTWVVAVWFAGALAFWLRLFGGWIVVARIRSRYLQPAPIEWQEVTRKLSARVHVSSARLVLSGRIHVPMVIGWIKPIVILPIEALTSLPSEYVEALLAHELAHIRRRDYLINLLQGIAEALLFYHPAVWWVSKHIRTERELCCDDIAASTTGSVLTYARALAEIESYRGGQLSAAMSASGGSLENRIARLLGQRTSQRAWPGTTVVVSAVLLILTTCGLLAQSSPTRFAMTSIRLNSSNANDTVALNTIRNPGFVTIYPGGRLVAGWTVSQSLIQEAYGLKPYQVSGGPDWIRFEHFDIDAKAAGNPNHEQMLVMLRSLLEERFKLKAHWETRPMSAYALTVAPGGSKLQPSREQSCVPRGGLPLVQPPPGRSWSGWPIPCGRAQVSLVSVSEGHLLAGKLSMAQFAADLTNILGRTVVDRTGLTGTFDLDVAFAPDDSLAGTRNSLDQSVPEDATGGSLFTAIQQNTGLKFEPGKTPVDVLVIDSVEKPTVE